MKYTGHEHATQAVCGPEVVWNVPAAQVVQAPEAVLVHDPARYCPAPHDVVHGWQEVCPPALGAKDPSGQATHAGVVVVVHEPAR